MTPRVEKTDEQWRAELTPEQYHVLREKGTERAFSGKYYEETAPGQYSCAGCGAELFASETKYDAGCGWPSFWEALDESKVNRHEDRSAGMRRVEVTCAACDGHLGHVFPDGPRETTGERFCINSAAIRLDPKD